MSAIGFNPSLHPANAANQAFGAKTPQDTKVAPPFVRGNPADRGTQARSLEDFAQVNGLIPRLEAAREGFQGSIDNLKKAIAKGDNHGAKVLLDRIGTYKLDELFKTDGVNPNILQDLRVALSSAKDPAGILKNVDHALKANGFKTSGPRNW